MGHYVLHHVIKFLIEYAVLFFVLFSVLRWWLDVHVRDGASIFHCRYSDLDWCCCRFAHALIYILKRP